MQENVQSALKSQMDMFEEFDAGTQISTENLLANMQSQVDGATAWEQNLSALADRGINQGILQKLSEMGPQGSGYVAAFNSMTDEELKKANDLWSQSVDIQGMTNEWGQQLLTSGAANIAGGMDGLTSVMQESGTNTVMGLVQGMQNAQEKANAAGKDLGVKTVEAVNRLGMSVTIEKDKRIWEKRRSWTCPGDEKWRIKCKNGSKKCSEWSNQCVCSTMYGIKDAVIWI